MEQIRKTSEIENLKSDFVDENWNKFLKENEIIKIKRIFTFNQKTHKTI